MYTSVAGLVLSALFVLLQPFVMLLVIVAALLAMGSAGSKPLLDQVLGDVGRGLRHLLGMILSLVFRALRNYFPWTMRMGRAGAFRVLSRFGGGGRRPRRWAVDLLGLIFSALIWLASYLLLFYPWIPTSALPTGTPGAGRPAWRRPAAPPPGGAPVVPPPPAAPAGTPAEQLARELSDVLQDAINHHMGGVEVRPGAAYTAAQVDEAIAILNDPARATALGLVPLRVSHSDRLTGFLRVTPLGGPGRRPIQDMP